MLTIKDLLNANITIRERATNTIVFSEIKNLENLKPEDLKSGNYEMTTSEIIWDLADFDLYLEYNEWYKTIAFYEFPKLLEKYETVEEIINFIKE